MMDFIMAHLGLLWLALAVICLIVELSSGDFFVICFAIGALVAVALSFFDQPFGLQLFLFALCSVACILFLRPSLCKWLHGKKEKASNADALIGRHAVVIETVSPEKGGYVKIDGDEWPAVCLDADRLEKGTQVIVEARESIVLTVKPLVK